MSNSILEERKLFIWLEDLPQYNKPFEKVIAGVAKKTDTDYKVVKNLKEFKQIFAKKKCEDVKGIIIDMMLEGVQNLGDIDDRLDSVNAGEFGYSAGALFYEYYLRAGISLGREFLEADSGFENTPVAFLSTLSFSGPGGLNELKLKMRRAGLDGNLTFISKDDEPNACRDLKNWMHVCAAK